MPPPSAESLEDEFVSASGVNIWNSGITYRLAIQAPSTTHSLPGSVGDYLPRSKETVRCLRRWRYRRLAAATPISGRLFVFFPLPVRRAEAGRQHENPCTISCRYVMMNVTGGFYPGPSHPIPRSAGTVRIPLSSLLFTHAKVFIIVSFITVRYTLVGFKYL